MKKQQKEKIDKIRFIISYIIRTLIIGSFFYAVYSQSWMTALVSGIALIISFAPEFVRAKYSVTLPSELEIIFLIFVYASVILGDIIGFYYKFWWWDILLHGISGLALGILGFMIVYALYVEEKIKAMPFMVALLSFCFAVTLGTIWEIYELAIDQILGLTTQMGLLDTMIDLILDSLGAIVASVSGYFYVKFGKGYFIDGFIKKFVKKNPKIFGKIKILKKFN